MKNLTFIVEETRTGFSAYEETLPIFTTGKDKADLLKNIHKASELYFDDSQEPFTITLR